MVLLIVAVSVLPLLLVSGFILLDFQRFSHEKVNAHLEELVAKHKQNIDNFLNAKLGVIRALAETIPYDELSREEILAERLAVLQKQDPFFVDIGLIDPTGIQVAYAGPFKLGRADYSEAEWFLKVKQREYIVSDVFKGLRGLPHFIVAVRNTGDGEPWILRATIDFAAFNNLVENIRIGQTGFAFILNRDGEFQTSPPRQLTLTAQPFLDFLENEAVDHGGIHVAEGTDGAGVKNIYVAAYLMDGDWLLVYQQNTTDAFSDFRNALKVALIIILLGGLASIATAAVVARKILAIIGESERRQQIMNQQIVETGKLASVGELAAGIAHEINNPVAIMVEEAGWIEDLLEDFAAGEGENLEELERALKQIKNQGDRCKQITHKLLSFARKTDTRVQEVNLYDLVEEMIALSAQRAKYSGVEIKTSLQPGLPTIRTSLSEMQQVFLNLINNALDAMSEGGGTLHITIRKDDTDLIIYVADTGTGIPEANLQRIFDPFFTTKPVGKGTGLGLSICYGIITKMGGEIDARSVLDVGTTFRIRIPLEKRGTAEVPKPVREDRT
jgi:two-component system NtrC family sensor kinase